MLTLHAGTVPVHAAPTTAPLVCADASHLVTDGFGGIGLATAAWLADQGARLLVLMGRRGATTRAKQRAVQALRQRAVAVHCAALDIAGAAQVRALVDRMGREQPPLKGRCTPPACTPPACTGVLTPAWPRASASCWTTCAAPASRPSVPRTPCVP